MNSLTRVLTALGHQEPDRVPLFLLLSLYGAKELKLTVKDYFSSVDNVVHAQLAMQKKYNNDCLYTFFYAALEVEAWGAEVVFVDDGPPNSGEPMLQSYQQITNMSIPVIDESLSLRRVLEVTSRLKQEVKDSVPIIGVVMSPFSLPVMQLGFEKYIEMLYFNKDSFTKLMKINEEFCVAWANAQIKAGATAICYFNPLASPTIIERNTYFATGYSVDQRTLARINGPTAMHLASGRTLPVLEDIVAMGSAVLGFSGLDSLEHIKKASQNKICLLGNMNAMDMVNWDCQIAEKQVKEIIAATGVGGGLILSDNHGEIPWQVSEDVLLAIGEAVRKWGSYPLNWVDKK